MTDKETIKTLYRIHWRSGLTGATGHGTGIFPRDQAESIANSLNEDEVNQALMLIHWAQAMRADEPNGVELTR